MAYECQSCYSRVEDGDVGENSLGDPQCPGCGSFDLVPIEESDELLDDLQFNDEDNPEIDQDNYNLDYSGD